MGKETKVKITQEQGNLLFEMALKFKAVQQLGEKTTYGPTEMLGQAIEVNELFDELKARSPHYLRERRLLFGPEDNWKKRDTPQGEGWELKDREKLVAVRLSDNARNGAFMCLLVALHPKSESVSPIGVHAEALWPMAKRLRLTAVLKKDLGFADVKHRRLDLDPEETETGDKPSPETKEHAPETAPVEAPQPAPAE